MSKYKYAEAEIDKVKLMLLHDYRPEWGLRPEIRVYRQRANEPGRVPLEDEPMYLDQVLDAPDIVASDFED